VFSHGNSPHSKHKSTSLAKAHEAIWHILFSRGTQPAAPFGHEPFVILGHFSQAIPQTPIFMLWLLSFGEFLSELFCPRLNLRGISPVGECFSEYLDAAAESLH
jgi:hypothetical protein